MQVINDPELQQRRLEISFAPEFLALEEQSRVENFESHIENLSRSGDQLDQESAAFENLQLMLRLHHDLLELIKEQRIDFEKPLELVIGASAGEPNVFFDWKDLPIQ